MKEDDLWKAVIMADRCAAARAAYALGVPDVQGERQLEILAREFARARLIAEIAALNEGDDLT